MPYKDPEKARAACAVYDAAHREELRAKHAAYYVGHAEEQRAYATAYYVAHPEERRVYNDAYRAAHREERRGASALYAATHREARRAYDAIYATLYPEKRRELGHRRRARLRSQFVAPVDAQLIYVRDRGRCHICGKKVKQADASMDHLIPISLGGIHAPWNVALAHLKCNLRRNKWGPAQALLPMEVLSQC